MTKAIQFLYRQSLRSWIIIAMIFAVLPLMASAVSGYIVYHRTIVQPFREVLSTQQDMLISLQRIQGDYWLVSEAVNAYVLTGDPAQAKRFATARNHVETQFDRMERAVADQPVLAVPVQAARAEWALVAATAQGLLDRERPDLADAIGDLGQVLEVERQLPAAALKLEELLRDVRLINEANHAETLRAFRVIEYGALAALVLSIGMMGLGGFIVNRAIVLSADELVAGAKRFAEGRHNRPVRVTVPPELAAVADAFNSMTRTILEQQERLGEYGRRDSLTGLLNRHEFDRALAGRLGAPGPHRFALLLADVDFFKQINDRHGHVIGDAVLRSLALTLQDEARDSGAAFRYGGEEFAILLDEAGEAEALAMAERLRRSVAALTHLPEAEITCSFGLALHPPVRSAEALLRAADAALYEAKAKGRNRVVLAA